MLLGALCLACLLPAASSGTGPGDGSWWEELGDSEMREVLRRPVRHHRASKAVLFVGDGMGNTARTAARIFQGQRKGEVGEYNVLALEEKLPFSAFSKTFDTYSQVSDSAATAFAMLSGVKTERSTFGYDDNNVDWEQCDTGATVTPTIAHHMKGIGGRVGVVTTTRVTHATPAALYAHTPERSWEEYADGGCLSIAEQLIESDVIDLALGGGAKKFYDESLTHPFGGKGDRYDGRNLVQEATEAGWRVVNTKQEMQSIDNLDGPVLGLFADRHMEYMKDSDGSEPTLLEMTMKAVELLEATGDKYFLLVESGRIDHAQHATRPYTALMEADHFDATISSVLDMIDFDETLVIATADHSHAFSISGYPDINNPIMGFTEDDYGPKSTLTYGAGPGFGNNASDLNQNVYQSGFDYPAATPAYSGVHGGDDVWIAANGPMAHLFSGVKMNSYIGTVLQYVTCSGRFKANRCELPGRSAPTLFGMPLTSVALLLRGLRCFHPLVMALIALQ